MINFCAKYINSSITVFYICILKLITNRKRSFKLWARQKIKTKEYNKITRFGFFSEHFVSQAFSCRPPSQFVSLVASDRCRRWSCRNFCSKHQGVDNAKPQKFVEIVCVYICAFWKIFRTCRWRLSMYIAQQKSLQKITKTKFLIMKKCTFWAVVFQLVFFPNNSFVLQLIWTGLGRAGCQRQSSSSDPANRWFCFLNCWDSTWTRGPLARQRKLCFRQYPKSILTILQRPQCHSSRTRWLGCGCPWWCFYLVPSTSF